MIPRWFKSFLLTYRKHITAFHDACMAALSFVLAVLLRLGEDYEQSGYYLMEGTFAFTCVAVLVFSFMGLYKGLWRYASLQDMMQIIKAVSLTVLLFIMLMFMVTRLEGVPRSALAINWLLLVILLAGPRVVYRIARDRGVGFDLFTLRDTRIPVLLIGAGNNAELFLRDTARKGISPFRVVGMVDDDKSKIDRQLRGVRIWGDLSVVGRVIDKLERRGAKPQRAIITTDQIYGDAIQQLLEVCESRGVALARLPSLNEFKPGDRPDVAVRPVAIEDLLGRPQNALDREAMARLIGGRRVLITGAGGSIGSELARQVAGFNPASVVLVDHSEFGLYAIDYEYHSRFPLVPRRSVLADIRNRDYMRHLLEVNKPHIVFHAAALKHVHLAEANPEETLRTNAVGTRHLADLCEELGVERMVMISTDKAVNPTGVMGASKRLAESYCQALVQAKKVRCRFITVRFGNVLGSTGSVIPLFQKQLQQGGPLTVTHPEITRYFMTIREAVGLVILAASMETEEQGGIYVLDMGKPVKIRDMAEQMIRLAGFRPGLDVHIAYTGLRPGEKMYEELFYAEESPQPTRYPAIRLAAARPVALKALRSALDDLEDACDAHKREKALKLLEKLVPEYQP